MRFSGRKRKAQNIFKKPKTLGEMKANQDEESQYGRKRDVPNAWDDNVIQKERNWKKFRKSKWK